MELVFDTNVLVSGLLHPDRPIAQLAIAIGRARLVPVYDRRVLNEYVRVFERPHLARKFLEGEAVALLGRIQRLGIDAGYVAPYSGVLPDEEDRPFVEVARATGAPIVTGNARHFPPSLGVQLIAAADLVRQLGV
jgi:predicted nucleic acid-binding protein